MSDLIEIFKSKGKPKEIMARVAQQLQHDNTLISELINYFPNASIPEKGHCIEAITEVTLEFPQFADSCLEFVIAQINDKAPRVKWESASVVANVAAVFPVRAAKAIPALLKNTKDEGTVVRWSAAKGLTEIAKANPEFQKKLAGFFSKIVSEETNNGVKNIYIKALKAIDKQNKNKH
jgi:hypothetical protein